MTRKEAGKQNGTKRLIDLTGHRFGNLIVIERVENDKNGMPRWKCLCDCGKTVIKYGHTLRNGTTTSCGCKTNDNISNSKKTHGLSKHPLHSVWANMKDRCLNKNNHAYSCYGGRGITICDEWMDFVTFFNWAIKNGYQSGLSIDRIDVNGNYCPDNCRWATDKEQANNQRNNHIIEYNGQKHNVKQWAEIFGVTYNSIYDKLRKGLSAEEIFCTL